MTDTVEVNGRTYSLNHYPQLTGCPVESLALRAVADLIDEGYTPRSPIYWNDQAIALLDLDGEPVSLIVYREREDSPAVFIGLGHTVAAAQRLGLYSALFKAFVTALRRKGAITRIEGGYHVANYASAAMNKALGRAVTYHHTVFEL